MFFICGLKQTILDIKKEQEIQKIKIKNLHDEIKILENLIILQNNRLETIEHYNPIENIIETVDESLSSPSFYGKIFKLATKFIL